MQKIIVISLCIITLVSFGHAANLRYKGTGPWQDVDPDGNADHGWQSAAEPGLTDTARANWAGGIITLDYETTVDKFQAGVNESGTFHILNGGILNTNSGGNKIGNNGACTGTMIIDEGAVVNSTGWLMIAGNSDVTGLAEVSGTLISASHLWMATGAASNATLNIYAGGYVDVKNNIGLGTVNASDPSGGVAQINVYDGLLRLDHWNYPGSIQDGSVIDIQFGTVEIYDDGNQADEAQAFANAGKITAFGGAGTLDIAHDSGTGVTTIKAIDPMNPSPAMGETVFVDENLILSWTNKDPNTPGAEPLVDVWFGTDSDDPNFFIKIVENGVDLLTGGVVADSVAVDASVVDTYYWRVDLVGSGNPDPNSFVYNFSTTDDLLPTVEILTPNTLTWAGRAVQLDAMVTDIGSSALHIEWSSTASPNVTFSDASIENPTVVSDSQQSNQTITIKVWDEYHGIENAVTDSIIIDFAADECQAAREGLGIVKAGDLNGDCNVDLADFAIMAKQWMDPYELQQPIEIQ